jgi:hypothetical protein
MTLEDRVEKIESDLSVIAQVVSAVTDDTLRVCLVLQELASGGYLPELPWDLCTALVALQYEKRSLQNLGEVDPEPVASRIEALEAQIKALRAAFRARANEQENG